MLSRPRYFSLWQNLRINPFETESFNKDFSFSGDLQFKFSFSRNFSNYYAVLSNCIVEEQTPEDEIRANLPAQVFRQKQKKDSFIQSQNVKKLNKKILLYSSKSDHDKGHRPLYYIPVITSVSLSEPDINDPETISTALIQGVVIYTPKPISQVILKTIKRTTLLFEKPVDVKTPESAAPDLFGIPDLEDLYHQENVKTTPHPQSVLIKTDDVELCRWIIAISAIFKLDTDCDTIDNLIKEKCVGFKLENNETDDWGLLFLNLDQVSGTQIPFQRVSAEFPFCYSSIYKNFFDIVYREKVMAMIHGKLHNWNSSVEQNAITRRDLDRAAVSAKVKALIVWFHKLHDAIQEIDDSLLTSEFDFLHSNQEEFGSLCFFAIPSIDDGVVKWSFDNISEGDYYKKLELLFEHVNNLKDDVPDEIEEVADVEDVVFLNNHSQSPRLQILKRFRPKFLSMLPRI